MAAVLQLPSEAGLAALSVGHQRQRAAAKALPWSQKRVDVEDPIAIDYLGGAYRFGRHSLEKDVAKAVELYERAAEQGVKEAHYHLGFLYYEGKDVEKDTAKMFQHYEAAAMLGHVTARHNLGCEEFDARNYDLSLQHWMIAAKLGREQSLNAAKGMFMKGLATKADYAAALRGYQSAIEEMSSPDRDEAKAERCRYIVNSQPG